MTTMQPSRGPTDRASILGPRTTLGPAGAGGGPAVNARRLDMVAGLAVATLGVVMLGLLGRVVQLQISPGERLMEQMRPRASTIPELPLRGDVTDRRGRVLSTTRFARRVIADPTLLPATPDTAIVRLADALGVPREVLGERITAALLTNDARQAALDAAKNQAGAPVAPEAAGTPDASAAGSAIGSAAGSAIGQAAGPTSEPTTEPAPGEATQKRPPKPIRYLVLSDPLPDHVASAVDALKIRGVFLEKVPIREYPGGAEVASIVGNVGFGDVGNLGVEKIHESRLRGERGRLTFVRDAEGKPLWIEPGKVQHARVGSDVRLALDLELQRIAHEELDRRIKETDAAGGRLVMLDPHTGDVLAMVDIIRDVPEAVPYPFADPIPPAPPRRRGQPAPPRPVDPPIPTGVRFKVINPDPGRARHPAMARNRCVEDQYEPGSTFKPFVWAALTDGGFVRPEEMIDTHGGRWSTPYGRPIEDVTKRGIQSWRDVLVNSSNIGMVKMADRMSHRQLRDAVLRFGFGTRTRVGLPFESAGAVTPEKAWTIYSQTSVAFGHEIAVTPVQMVRAFAAFARDGDEAGTLPPISILAASPDAADAATPRVVSPDVARTTRYAMTSVVDNLDTRMANNAKQAGEEPPTWAYTMFGKSGTAEIPIIAPKGKRLPRGSSGYFEGQYFSSFIAGGPIEDPRLVVLVVIDDPGPRPGRPRSERFGTAVAGPAVRRVMERALTYLAVPPSPPRAKEPATPPAPRSPQGAAPRQQQTPRRAPS